MNSQPAKAAMASVPIFANATESSQVHSGLKEQNLQVPWKKAVGEGFLDFAAANYDVKGHAGKKRSTSKKPKGKKPKKKSKSAGTKSGARKASRGRKKSAAKPKSRKASKVPVPMGGDFAVVEFALVLLLENNDVKGHAGKKRSTSKKPKGKKPKNKSKSAGTKSGARKSSRGRKKSAAKPKSRKASKGPVPEPEDDDEDVN